MNLSELINQNFIHFQDHLYVKESLLTEKFNVPLIILTTGAEAFSSGSSHCWKYLSHQENRWFDYTYLPPEVLSRYNIPQKSELIEELKSSISASKEKQENHLYEREMLAIKIALDHADLFLQRFKERGIQQAKAKSYCNSYALLFVLRQFDHLKTYEHFNLYLAVSDSNFSFQTRSLNHFYTKMKDIDRVGLVQGLLHKGTSNLNAVRLSEYHEKLIGHFYRKGSKLS